MNQEKQIKQLVAAFEKDLRRTVEQFESDGLNYVNGFARIGKIRLEARSNQPSNQLHIFLGATLAKDEFPEFGESLPRAKRTTMKRKRTEPR